MSGRGSRPEEQTITLSSGPLALSTSFGGPAGAPLVDTGGEKVDDGYDRSPEVLSYDPTHEDIAKELGIDEVPGYHVITL